MEENNKPQDPQNPSLGQPNEAPQTDPQNNAQNIPQYNRESTYWENNASGQYQQTPDVQNAGRQADQYAGQPQQPSANEQGAGSNTSQQAQTPEQFYQYYQQQMNSQPGNQQTYGQPQYNPQQYSQQQQQQYQQPQYQQQQYQQQQYSQQQYQQQYTQPQNQPGAYQKPKKKHRVALIAAIVVLLLLVAGAATAYAFKDTLMNSYAKATKSPAEYYAYIEKNAIEEAVNDISSTENVLQNNKNGAYDVSTEVTVNRDTLDPLLESYLGVSLSDLESEIGIPLDSFGFNAEVGMDGNILNEKLGLSLNKVSLITMELFMDSAAEKMLLRLPELSDAYLSLSGEDTGASTAQLEKMTPELLADLFNRYSGILIDNINQVSLEDNTELSIDTLTTKCTKLTVTVTEQDAYNMVLELLKTAKEDQKIIDLLPMFNLTEEEYQDYIDNAVDEMEAASDTVTDKDATMVVYVNDKGEIIGREFSMDGTDASLGYTTLSKNNYDEYQIFVNDETGSSLFSINGSQKKVDGSYDGDATIEVHSGIGTYSDLSVGISYEDVYQEKKNNQVFQYGSFTLSSPALMGLQITMDFNVEDNAQKSKLVLQMGSSPLVTVDTTSNYVENYKATMPPENSEIYDIDQADSYLATFNIEDYISNLSDKLGVDLQSILDYFMYGYY